jgi:hypothetical protein
MSLLPNVLLVFAIAAVGVVYGVDVFFAVVGRRALAHSSNAAIAEVMGRFHEVADARMPVFGVSGVSLFCHSSQSKMDECSINPQNQRHENRDRQRQLTY